MGMKDPRVDAYIRRSAEFARPILSRIRTMVHATCPDVEETLKWGMPTFMYHGIMCGMAGFKQHATVGFWKSSLILDKNCSRADEAMGQFGRLYSVKDLPPKAVFAGYIRKAMALNATGVKVVRRATKARPRPRTPPDLRAALGRNAKAFATWQAFSASKQREYVEWITEAKTDPTRKKRIATSIGWIAEGKSRNWKYLNC
jgi:uncharacterized protein YdeI (YjbR/CyaY-like superfamily)